MDDFLNNVLEVLKAISQSQVYKTAIAPFALRIYAFIGLATITIIAVLYAIKLFRLLHRETRFETLLGKLKIPGPRPTKEKSKQAQLQRRKDTVKKYVSQTTSKIVITLILGVFLPLAVILIITIYGSWFFPNTPVLVDRNTGASIANPSSFQIIVYATDLFLKGSLNDFLEGFNKNIGPVSYATSNILYTIFVILFRMAADLFVATLVFFVVRTMWNWKAANREAMRLAIQNDSE